MKYKTSCFNPGLSRDALRRFWPLPVGSFLLFFVSLVLPFYHELHSRSVELLSQYNYVSEYGESVQDVADYFAGAFTLQTMLLAVLAPTAAMLVFHHLHGKKEIQFYLSLPVRRSCLYLTSMLTGLLMVLVPMLLCHGLTVGICLYSGVVVQPALRLLAVCSLLLLLFYGMAVLACVLAGQRFGAFLLYAGMHVAALVIWIGLSQVSELFIPGFSATVAPPQWALWLMPLVKLFSDDNVLNSLNRLKLTIPLIYGIVGILLLVFSGVLYQIRRAETAGDMLSFSAIKLLSKIFAALAVGLGGFALLQLLAFPDRSVPFWGLLLLLLVLIAVGWIAAEMIIQKSFRIFHSRSVLTGGALLLLCAAAMLGARADAFGYVHRTPELSHVESASLSISPWQSYDSTEVSPADALAIHKMLLEHIDQLGSFDITQNSIQLSISYGLNGGTTMERTYFFNEDELPELVQATLSVLDQPENVERRLFAGWIAEPSVKTFSSGSVYSYYDENRLNLTRNGDDFSELSAQEAVTLYHAICEDIKEGNVLSPSHLLYFPDEDCPDNYGDIYLDFFTKPYDASTGSYTQYQENTPHDSASFDLFSTMTHTIAALEDMGFEIR